MMNKCPHSPELGRCSHPDLPMYSDIVSPGTCLRCKENPLRGIWPTIEQKPRAQDMPSAAVMMCDRPLAPAPRKDWPLWATAIAEREADGDRGVGDTVAREIGTAQSERFKAWYQLIHGGTCGCEDRQARWNEEYPYRRVIASRR